MGAWQDLPAEIALYIVQYLGDTPTLYNASLVSRQFHALVEPHLYSDVWIEPSTDNIYEPYDDDADDNDNEGKGEDIRLAFRRFVRTIAGRPELGLHVKTLGLTSCLDLVEYYDSSDDYRRCHEDMNDEKVQKALLDAPSDEAREDLADLAKAAIAKGLHNGLLLNAGSRGLLLLLLHLVPNLQHLYMSSLNETETVALSCLGHFDGGVPPGLLSLRSLELTYDDTEMGYCTEAVVPFLTLPNLRSLSVKGFTGVDRGHGFLDNHPSVLVDPEIEQFDDNEETEKLDFPTILNEQGESRNLPVDTPYGFIMPPRCSLVTELIFKDCAVESALLGRILTLPNKLESFEYEIGSSIIGEEPFIPSALIDGLQAQASTLKKIIISTGREADYESQLTDEADDRLLGPLTGLIALQHLSVPLDLLLPLPSEEDDNNDMAPVTKNPLDRLLPPSLAHLELDLARNWALDDFLTITGLPHTLQRTSGSLPALRMFKVYTSRDEDKQAGKRINAGWQKRDSSAVEFEIKYLGG